MLCKQEIPARRVAVTGAGDVGVRCELVAAAKIEGRAPLGVIDRQFRVRPAFDVEIEDFARHGAIERTLPEKLCWWVVVHQIRSGIRMRFPLAAPHHFPTEVSEATARNVWAERCPPE